MIDVMKYLNKKLQEVNKEAYLEVNTAVKVTYPYITYEVDREAQDGIETGINLDVDIFDNSLSYKKILEQDEKLMAVLDGARLMTDDFLIFIDHERSSNIKTGDENIKRRNVQFYCRVIWR